MRTILLNVLMFHLFATQECSSWLLRATKFRFQQSCSLLASKHLFPDPSCEPSQMSGSDLAYIGDCVYELFVRSKAVWPSVRTAELNQRVFQLVNADHQSKILQKLMVDFELEPAELQVLRRGRNSCRKKNRKNPAADQDSTALEALIGYLYIQGGTDRLELLFEWLDNNLENV